MNTKIALLAIVLATAACFSDAAPAKEAAKPGYSFDITGDDLSNNNNIILLPYEPVEPKLVGYKSSSTGAREDAPNNKLRSSSFTVVERELIPASTSNNNKRQSQVVVAASQGDDAERSGSPNVEKMKDIALNSREVRLVGPNQREVEMKDDVASKVVVALENLQKEASEVLSTVNEKLDKSWTDLKKSEVWTQVNDKIDKGLTDIKRSEVWGQVNEKLDKGWTDLKSMMEGLVSPSSANKSG